MARKKFTAEFKAKVAIETYPKYLTVLSDQEAASRQQKRIHRHIKEAKLPPGKTVDHYSFKETSSVNAARFIIKSLGKHQEAYLSSKLLIECLVVKYLIAWLCFAYINIMNISINNRERRIWVIILLWRYWGYVWGGLKCSGGIKSIKLMGDKLHVTTYFDHQEPNDCKLHRSYVINLQEIKLSH